jgi:hypothetical protein
MAKSLFPKIEKNESLKKKFFETVKNILQSFAYTKEDASFESFRDRILSSIENKSHNDVQKSILRFEYDSDDIYNEKRSIKQYYSQIISTDYSSKMDKMDKIEYILNKENNESPNSPNIDLFAHEPIKDEAELANLKLLANDNIPCKSVTRVKLPYCRVAIDITLSAIQIKQIFINELNR